MNAFSSFSRRFLIGHFAHWGRVPGGKAAEAARPDIAGDGDGDEGDGGDEGDEAGAVPRNPNSQSAEHECTRQIVASISALGVTTPLSQRAQFCCFTLTARAISD